MKITNVAPITDTTVNANPVCPDRINQVINAKGTIAQVSIPPKTRICVICLRYQPLLDPAPQKIHRPSKNGCTNSHAQQTEKKTMLPDDPNQKRQTNGHQNISAPPVIISRRKGRHCKRQHNPQPNQNKRVVHYSNRAGKPCAQALIVPAPKQTTISPGFACSRTRRSNSSSDSTVRA